ncbi:uncharacterized protein LOC107764191 [Nicotiana tabacum]|uniref:Uncharacterized protein LOC107764191 n=1 Tax=Nicotiana tabacum TaxID=4097 RepID=A0A1S3XEA8_TOBAC|nr:PREDICTED: uncharacterized protein LOC107764191 [Nicotiana tabacum]XP_018631034.1 uncharacterized protein LOC108947481 isoform X1 [Nicotiana tomentosiformis]
MSNDVGKPSLGKLTDSQRDELLLQLAEQVQNLKTRVRALELQNSKPPTDLSVNGKKESVQIVSHERPEAAEDVQQLDQPTNPTEKRVVAKRPLQMPQPPSSRPLLNGPLNENQGTMGNIRKKVKMDLPDFDGKLNPTIFADWLSAMEDYFDWYDLSDERRVTFAKMKLTALAKEVVKSTNMTNIKH